MLTIRKALPEDHSWIITSYESINFQPSDFKNELVVVALWNDKYAGIARLIPLDEQSAELGGMYVSPVFRGKGIARQLVEHLLGYTEGRQLFCIPFNHLTPFYLSCGFKPISSAMIVPCALKQKLDWCENTYSTETSILRYSAE